MLLRLSAAVIAVAALAAAQIPPKEHTSDAAFYCKDVHGGGIIMPDDGSGRRLQAAASGVVAQDPYMTAGNVGAKCVSAANALWLMLDSPLCVPTCQKGCQAAGACPRRTFLAPWVAG